MGLKLIVAAAILDSLTAPTRLLAARRTYPPELAGRWELAGGKVEPGEDAASALARELAEELGIEVRLGARFPAPNGGDWPLPGVGQARVWPAEVMAGEPTIRTAGHDRLVWLPADALHRVAWLDGDLPIIEALQTDLDWVHPRQR